MEKMSAWLPLEVFHSSERYTSSEKDVAIFILNLISSGKILHWYHRADTDIHVKNPR